MSVVEAEVPLYVCVCAYMCVLVVFVCACTYVNMCVSVCGVCTHMYVCERVWCGWACT